MQSTGRLSASTFLKHQEAPQSLGKQKWGKLDDYIQILEYIPFKQIHLLLSMPMLPVWITGLVLLLLFGN